MIKVLFNDSCSICSKEIRHYKSLDNDINWIDINDLQLSTKLSGKSHEELIRRLHVIKDNMFDVPPLFKLIQEQSGTDWKEMYKVFNMGHRMEIYINEEHADDIKNISKEFGVDAKIIGRVEQNKGKKLTIKSPYGEYVY